MSNVPKVNLRIVPLSERLDLQGALWSDELLAAWPAFMLEDPTANFYYADGRFDRFHDFVLVAFDEEKPDVVLARACSVPFCFGKDFRRDELPGGGWDTVVRWADYDHFLGRKPNAVSALEIVVSPTMSGQGLSAQMVKAMKENARRLGFKDLYAPVRPSQKQLEPHTPMQEYVKRTRADGLPFDAWLRVHVRSGGKMIKIAPHSMTISATLAEWRGWTTLPFDESGEVVVPGALVPVHVSLEQDHAVYVEPNVWVHHSLS